MMHRNSGYTHYFGKWHKIHTICYIQWAYGSIWGSIGISVRFFVLRDLFISVKFNVSERNLVIHTVWFQTSNTKNPFSEAIFERNISEIKIEFFVQRKITFYPAQNFQSETKKLVGSLSKKASNNSNYDCYLLFEVSSVIKVTEV